MFERHQHSTSSFVVGLLLCAGGSAVTAFVGWPWIKANFSPDMTPYTESGPYHGSDRNRAFVGNRQMRAPGMRLDLNVPPGQVEGRRPGHGDMSGDLGGGDIGRLSPSPQARRPRPYTDGRDVEMPRRREEGGAPHHGRGQITVCSTPWWDATNSAGCGPWQ